MENLYSVELPKAVFCIENQNIDTKLSSLVSLRGLQLYLRKTLLVQCDTSRNIYRQGRINIQFQNFQIHKL